jgi:type IV secretion system protein VirB3
MLGRPVVNIDAPWYFRRFIRNTLGQTARTITQATKAARSAIDEAPLFVADTRPAMFFGVPHVAAVLLIAAFGESIIFVGPIYAFWIIVPWCAMRIAVRQDYNAPRILVLWMMTKALSFDAFTWHGSSRSPFPVRTGKYPRGIWSI